MIKLNPNSHLTAKERDSISFPARQLLNRGLLKGEVLDFGCGFGKDVEILRDKGFKIQGYDPHYFPSYPNQKFDTIICFYVLNVLHQEEQSIVLMEISQLLKPTGSAYMAVRRDVHKSGYRIHKIHQKPTYQCNVVLPFASIFKNDSCEIYEYKLFNQRPIPQNNDCPFCYPGSEVEIITESATAYAIFAKNLVSLGHVLIIPKRHCEGYFDLSFREQAACLFMVNFVQSFLNKKFKPTGFKIEINTGTATDQTVSHAHIHLIPNY